MNPPITEKDKDLLNLLNAHPTLRHRIEALMQIVEDTDGIIEKADAAEQRIIEELRKLGHVALTGWAEGKKEQVEKRLKEESGLRSAGKKTVVAKHL
jgi:hypothetical protein